MGNNDNTLKIYYVSKFYTLYGAFKVVQYYNALKGKHFDTVEVLPVSSMSDVDNSVTNIVIGNDSIAYNKFNVHLTALRIDKLKRDSFITVENKALELMGYNLRDINVPVGANLTDVLGTTDKAIIKELIDYIIKASENVLAISANYIKPMLILANDNNGVVDIHDTEPIVDILAPYVTYMNRDILESTTHMKQIIPYVIVTDEFGRIFTYKRGRAGGESGLYDLLSIGVGGHVPLKSRNLKDNILDSIRRELLEEIGVEIDINDIDDPEVYVYDGSNEVGRRHIGLVYNVQINLDDYDEDGGELDILENREWLTPDELMEIDDIRKEYIVDYLHDDANTDNPPPELETWSRLLIKVL